MCFGKKRSSLKTWDINLKGRKIFNISEITDFLRDTIGTSLSDSNVGFMEQQTSVDLVALILKLAQNNYAKQKIQKNNQSSRIQIQRSNKCKQYCRDINCITIIFIWYRRSH